MKNNLCFWTLLVFAVIVCALSASCAHAAGSCAITVNDETSMIRKITWTCTGDAIDGSIPSVASPYLNGWVFQIITSPGSPAPSNGYTLTLLDDAGVDIAAGALATRSDTLPQEVRPAGRYVSGYLTPVVTGQSISGAVIVIMAYYYRAI